MGSQNVFAVLVRPTTDLGLACLRQLRGGNVLVVGAVGGAADADCDNDARIRDTQLQGIDMEPESALAEIVDRCDADVVIDCSGDASHALELLSWCFSRGVSFATPLRLHEAE